jgi:hypothetical protein
MSTQTDERPPHGLQALYESELGRAPFSIDDIVAGGERRLRRRRAGVGSAVAVAAAVVLAVSVGSPFERDRLPAPPAGPTPSATPTAGTSSVALDGCTLVPIECADTIEYWASQSLHGGRDTTVDRQPAATGYGPGALAFQEQSGPAGERLGVVVAPAWAGAAPADRARTVRLGSPAAARVETTEGGAGYRQVWTVPGEPGVHGGIRVVLEGPRDTRLRHWDDSTVAGLLDVLLGVEQEPAPPPPPAPPRSDSVGCSLRLANCDGDTLAEWIAANLGAQVTPQIFPLMDGERDDAKRIGDVILGSYGEEGSQATVAVSFAKGVARFGGLYGDATLEPGSPRSVPLPSGGAASVHTWSAQGTGTYREMWLVPAAPGRGEMRVLLKQGAGGSAGAKRPPTPVERLTDAAVVDLIEDFR